MQLKVEQLTSQSATDLGAGKKKFLSSMRDFSAEDRNSALEKELGHLKEAYKKKKEALSKAEKDTGTLREMRSIYKENEASYLQQMHEKDLDMAALQAVLDEDKSKMAQYGVDLDLAIKDIAASVDRMTTMQAANEALYQQNNSLAGHNEQLTMQLQSVDRQLADKASEIQRMKGEHTKSEQNQTEQARVNMMMYKEASKQLAEKVAELNRAKEEQEQAERVNMMMYKKLEEHEKAEQARMEQVRSDEALQRKISIKIADPEVKTIVVDDSTDDDSDDEGEDNEDAGVEKSGGGRGSGGGGGDAVASDRDFAKQVRENELLIQQLQSENGNLLLAMRRPSRGSTGNEDSDDDDDSSDDDIAITTHTVEL